MHVNSDSQQSSNEVKQAIAQLEAEFRAANPRSLSIFERGRDVMPGGNTRAVLYYDPFPLTFVKGEGATVTDADGHTYADYLGEYAAGLYGHSDPRLKKAAIDAIESGVMLGGLNQFEAPFAELIRSRFPSMEKLRFVNSGTEANLFAITTARLATKRDSIVVFNGGYHGGLLTFGGGAKPHNAPFPTHICTYNDIASTDSVLSQHGPSIACVVIEPMLGSGGGCRATPTFMNWLRQRTRELNIPLLFDEVVTSRMSGGGLQARLGVTPDLTTIGKYFGGGFTFGAFGGREDLMRVWDLTQGGIAHGGTFNNNPISLAAGMTGLRDIFTPEAADRLYERGETLATRIRALSVRHGVPLQCVGAGSVMTLQVQHKPIERPTDICTPPEARKVLHLAMLSRGQSIGRRGYITLSIPQTTGDDDAFIHALDDVLYTYKSVLNSIAEQTA